MRTYTRITLGIATIAVGLTPVTAALADSGSSQLPAADEGTTIITIVPVTTQPDDALQVNPSVLPDLEVLSPDDDLQVDPSYVGEIELEAVDPNDDLQVDPSNLGEIELEALDPNDDGFIEAVPTDPQLPDWVKEAIQQAVADALAEQGTDGPADVTVEVVAPVGDDDPAQVAAETAAEARQSNSWPYAVGGAAAVLAIWAMLGLGARMGTRRN